MGALTVPRRVSPPLGFRNRPHAAAACTGAALVLMPHRDRDGDRACAIGNWRATDVVPMHATRRGRAAVLLVVRGKRCRAVSAGLSVVRGEARGPSDVRSPDSSAGGLTGQPSAIAA